MIRARQVIRYRAGRATVRESVRSRGARSASAGVNPISARPFSAESALDLARWPELLELTHLENCP